MPSCSYIQAQGLREVGDGNVVVAFVVVSYAAIVECEGDIVLGIASSTDDCGASADGSIWVSLDFGAVPRGSSHAAAMTATIIAATVVRIVQFSTDPSVTRIRRSNITFQGLTSNGLSIASKRSAQGSRPC